ncbi:GGDEF domain-containing protein [Dehalobacter sp. DCM]|uniref:GGDEF domain-containing protein n=1 Tax=Dehalobacter sp. DCM TaxID=2907827 RepID=UPI0030819845|nr:GGDEF domain-containing protein [Dehalobacter sp. DCM]
MENSINRMAEFRDKRVEKEFHLDEVNKGLRFSRNTVLVFSITNFLFVILDYLYLAYSDLSIVINNSLVPRLVVVLLAIGVYVMLKKPKDPAFAIRSVLVYAMSMYLIHEYIAVHFAPVDLIFEVFDIVLITFGLFVIPNRWVENVCTSVILTIILVVLSPFTMPGMAEGTKVMITIYLFSQILVVSILMHRINVQKRQNYLQQLRLEALARTDALTNTPNRAACDRTLKNLCTSHAGFSLILFDIDDFKQINDNYGHIIGDDVIIRIVNAVKNIVRQDDIVARWGGEEFIIILPGTSLDIAMEIANRTNEFLSTIRHGIVTERVTASFGVTEVKAGDDTKSIINRADKLLYLAKEFGKNRVIAG